MSGFKSGSAARLLVEVIAPSEIALDRHCPRCKLRRRFASSGKFRVNAQKKRIDAWLIFRCTICDDRWNWPIHERRPVGALDPAELDALMRNDPALAARHGWVALQAGNVRAAPDAAVQLTVLEPATGATEAIEIVVTVAGASLRLDRLLAQALNLARREIEDLAETAAMTVMPAASKALRRPAIDGQRITIDLARCPDKLAARLRSRAEAQRPDLYCATLSPR
jgi:hypothetical protein